MRFWSTKDPKISYLLAAWYVLADQSIAEIGARLHERLKNDPDNTFCCVAIEGAYCKAILIAYVREDDVYIWQAQSSPGFRYGDLMLDAVSKWAIAKSRDKLRMKCEPKRRRFFERRYGFTNHNGEMEKRLCPVVMKNQKVNSKLNPFCRFRQNG